LNGVICASYDCISRYLSTIMLLPNWCKVILGYNWLCAIMDDSLILMIFWIFHQFFINLLQLINSLNTLISFPYVVVLIDVNDYIIVIDSSTSHFGIICCTLNECSVQISLLGLMWWMHDPLFHLYWLKLINRDQLGMLVILEIRINASFSQR